MSYAISRAEVLRLIGNLAWSVRDHVVVALVNDLRDRIAALPPVSNVGPLRRRPDFVFEDAPPVASVDAELVEAARELRRVEPHYDDGEPIMEEARQLFDRALAAHDAAQANESSDARSRANDLTAECVSGVDAAGGNAQATGGAGSSVPAAGLLPCPFCGSDDVKGKGDEIAYLPPHHWIILCRSCGASGPNTTRERVMDGWNRRPDRTHLSRVDRERLRSIAKMLDDSLSSVAEYRAQAAWLRALAEEASDGE